MSRSIWTGWPRPPPATTAPTVTGSRVQVVLGCPRGAYARLGFTDAVGNDTFKKLVLARVVEPTSKADTLRVLGELGVPGAPSLWTIWRTLARSVEQDWRSQLAAAACAHATRSGADASCSTTSPPSTSRRRMRTSSARSG